ncbi:MAG: hypothetical protein OXU71_11500 [Gammaproteobacteria bacterium]|nr:hypothetical protein [Gammaproteobacteria bacterium]
MTDSNMKLSGDGDGGGGVGEGVDGDGDGDGGRALRAAAYYTRVRACSRA